MYIITNARLSLWCNNVSPMVLLTRDAGYFLVSFVVVTSKSFKGMDCLKLIFIHKNVYFHNAPQTE